MNKAYSYVCHLGDFLSGAAVPRRRQVLINGFWRSGTTWVQETLEKMLDARSVFEPFNYHNSEIYNSPRQFAIKRCLPEFSPPRHDFRFANPFMPYVSDSFERLPETRKAIDAALRGQLVMRMYGDRRKPLSDCFASTVVTKFTRASLCLNAIARTFEVPIVHVCRDPRAVVTSITRLDGGHFAEDSFNQLSLVEQLLQVDDGRRRYFQQWQSDIEALENSSVVGRIAAYFCLTERFLEDSFQFDPSRRHRLVRYEDLVMSQGKAFERLVVDLGLRSSGELDLDAPSTTDWNNAAAERKSALDRIHSWQKRLAPRDQDLIADIVKTFGMEHRLWHLGGDAASLSPATP
ncbi:MAG: sulfotransferase [Leptolyngbyaceae cyanobacterium]